MAIDISNADIFKFTWEGLGGEESLRIYTSNFGENYQERRGRGINPIESVWSVNFFFESIEEARGFRDLLRGAASEVFLWKSPLDLAASTYVINSWSIEPTSPILYQFPCSLKSWYGNT